ncbi:helix-turn-helix transcriptional regulator [Deinococcus sp. 12RED42]|uniref:helix-turn-helix domain-containing protein n=1 Tax=Deinococcus sp. 12RED42 TaxID=2745872 RepID=UPI001E2A5D0C|nr:helix-turn-helix transcriptional regulator [Deinococcus sp. 12RED42]MCD0164454.1 helix-turn-helix domain-containing protein [Deinococcus sp. 12RED42]
MSYFAMWNFQILFDVSSRMSLIHAAREVTMPFDAEKALKEHVDAYLTPIQLGEELRSFIKRSGKTQRQVAEEAGMPQPSYLSHMVNGRINWVESAYFPGLVTALNLSLREIKKLRPDIVTQLVTAAVQAGTFDESTVPEPKARTLPQGLQEAIELHGKRYSDLRDPTWQNYLAGFRWREGEPEEPEAWLDLYRDLTRAGVVPGSN